MHSAWFRGNAVFFFGLAVLAVMSIACAYRFELERGSMHVCGGSINDANLAVSSALQHITHL